MPAYKEQPSDRKEGRPEYNSLYVSRLHLEVRHEARTVAYVDGRSWVVGGMGGCGGRPAKGTTKSLGKVSC